MSTHPAFSSDVEVRPYVAPPVGTPDGAPVSTIPAGHRLLGTQKSVRPRRMFEGLRGSSSRAAIRLRYVSYFLIIVLGATVTSACFASTPGASSGGEWLLFSAAFQLATAAVGSWFDLGHRPEIIQQVRAYVFGYTILPGTGVAVFMWAASHLGASPGSPDVFISSLQTALPWIFFLPVVLPAVIFMKTVAGMRVINREQMDDQELMNIITRNDGLQR